MIKFKNKVDGSVFYAEPDTVQFRVLNIDKNYEEVKEERPIKKGTTKK